VWILLSAHFTTEVGLMYQLHKPECIQEEPVLRCCLLDACTLQTGELEHHDCQRRDNIIK
jgi:hypothetical protein